MEGGVARWVLWKDLARWISPRPSESVSSGEMALAGRLKIKAAMTIRFINKKGLDRVTIKASMPWAHPRASSSSK